MPHDIFSNPNQISKNLYELYCSTHVFRGNFEKNPRFEDLRNRLKELENSPTDCEFISKLAQQQWVSIHPLIEKINWDLLRDTIPSPLRLGLFCQALPTLSSLPLNFAPERERVQRVLAKCLLELVDFAAFESHHHQPSWAIEKLNELQGTCQLNQQEKEFFDTVIHLNSGAALAKMYQVRMTVLKETLPFVWKREMIDGLVAHITHPLNDNPLQYKKDSPSYRQYLEAQQLLEKLAKEMLSPMELFQLLGSINQGLDEKINRWTGFQRTLLN